MKTIKLPLGNTVAKLSSDVKTRQIDAQKPATRSQVEQNSSSPNHTVHRNKQLQQLEKQIDILEKSLQEAREEAFEAGIEEGKERAEVEFQKVKQEYRDQYTKLVESLETKFNDALEKLQRPLLELAFKIAEKVIERELEHKSDYSAYFEKLIKKYLGEIIKQGEITIQLNPDQLKQISIDDLVNELSTANKVHLVENSDLDPGDCIIETNRIKIDARIARQLENLKSYETDI